MFPLLNCFGSSIDWSLFNDTELGSGFDLSCRTELEEQLISVITGAILYDYISFIFHEKTRKDRMMLLFNELKKYINKKRQNVMDLFSII